MRCARHRDDAVSARPRAAARSAPLTLDVSVSASKGNSRAKARGAEIARIQVLSPRNYYALAAAQVMRQPLVAEIQNGVISIRVKT